MTPDELYSLMKKEDSINKQSKKIMTPDELYSLMKGKKEETSREEKVKNYGLRPDKTQKGMGYFGEIPMNDKSKKIMGELSTTVTVDGEEIQLPLIVPSLDRSEIDHLASGKPATKTIIDKAVKHALERKSEGKSPYATLEEEGKTVIPKKNSFYNKIGQAFAYQAQTAPPPETLPQLGAGALEELSLGAVNVNEATTPAGKVAREAGKYGLGFPAEMKVITKVVKPIANLFAPHKWIGRILGIGTAGSVRSVAQQYFKEGEVDPKEALVEGAIWGTLEAGGELVISALHTKQAIDFISKASGKSKVEVAKFLADKFKTKWKEKFGFEPTEENVSKFMKEKPKDVADIWENSTKEAKETLTPEKEIKPEEIKKPEEVKEPIKPKIPPVTDYESLTPDQQAKYSDLLVKLQKSGEYSAHEGKNITNTKESADIYRQMSELPYLNDYDKKRYATLSNEIIKKLELTEKKPKKIKEEPIKPIEEIKPKPEENGIKLTGMGTGMMEDFYKGIFKSLTEGKDTFSGVKDPLIGKAKPYYDKGLIKTWEDLRDFANKSVVKEPKTPQVLSSRKEPTTVSSGGTSEKKTVPLIEKTRPKDPVMGTKQSKKRSDIIKLFRKAFTDPIRLGKFKSKRGSFTVSGIHKLYPKVTRLLHANDIETAAHEIGHNLHTTLYGGDATDQTQQAMNIGYALRPYLDELKPIARYEPFGMEGFAEFTRMYVTNPETAKELAPKFYQKFEADLAVQYPEMLEALLTARKYYDTYLQGTPESRVDAQIAYPESVNWFTNLKEALTNPYKFDKIKTLVLDDLFPIKRMVAEAFEISPLEVESLTDEKNLYIAMRLLKSAMARADVMVMHETYGFGTLKRTGEGYADIIKELKNDEDYKEFNRYLVARRTLEKLPQGIETGINQGDAIITVANLEKIYGGLAKRWDAFWDRLLIYTTNSGLISQEAAIKIKENNLMYAPFQRDMEKVKNQPIGTLSSQAKNPIKRMKGSTRDIIPPIEAGLANIYSMVINAEKNRVGKILAKLSGMKNMGLFVERVPTPTTIKDKIEKKDAIEQIENHLKKLGMAGRTLGEVSEYIEGVLPDAFLRFGATTYPAGENIITVFYDGKPKYFEVSPEIYETFNRGTSPYITGLLSTIPRFFAKTLRAGAILNPRFAMKNVVRDTWERWIFTKFGKGAKDPVGLFTDCLYQPLMMLAEAAGEKELYVEWMKAGGGMSTMQGSSRDAIVKHLDEVRKGVSPFRILKWFRKIAGWGEEANRIAEYAQGKKVFPDSRWGKELAAFASRDVSIDFLKTGLWTKIINSVIPFFNVAFQGTDKTVRMFADPKTRARAIYRMLAAITIPSALVWYLNKDDKEIKELPDSEKDRNLIFRIFGALVKIPVPFEPGILSHGLTQRMLDFIIARNPDAFKGFMGTILEAATPSIIPTLPLPFMEVEANKNFFTGRKIIPYNMEDLTSRYQYKTNTSLTSRLIGRGLTYLLGPDTKSKVASPIVIDHFINAWTGGLGRLIVNTTDMALEAVGLGDKIPKPHVPITEKLGLDAFKVRHPRSSAKSIEQFYDYHKEFVSLTKSSRYAKKQEVGTEEEREQGYERIYRLYDKSTMDRGYKAMQMCQREINEIYNAPDIDPKTKTKMIDDLYDSMIEFAKVANEDIRFYRKDNK
jgi:hypothetical protein